MRLQLTQAVLASSTTNKTGENSPKSQKAIKKNKHYLRESKITSSPSANVIDITNDFLTKYLSLNEF